VLSYVQDDNHSFLSTHYLSTLLKSQHSFSYVFPSDMEEERRHTSVNRLVQLLSRFYPNNDAHRNIGDSLRRAHTNCEPSDPASTVTDRLNNLLKKSGNGYVLQLCPKETYLIQAPIVFASPNQEISTLGHPTNDDRAILLVSGPVFPNGTGHTTAVDGGCSTCSNVILRNIQVCRNILDQHLPYSNVLNRLMVRVEIQLLSKEEQTLRWEETTKIKLSNLFGLSIQEVGPVSMLLKGLWLATVSSCRTTTLVRAERTYSNNGPTGSASAAKTPSLGIT
jgi:hypothetical protein